MSLSVEELLRDRYKVIAQYPNTPYEIGDLVNISDDGNLFHAITTWVGPDGQLVEQKKYYHSVKTLQKFPHLFKKLEWWEDRKPDELPAYIKSLRSGNCYEKEFKDEIVRYLLRGLNGTGVYFLNNLSSAMPITESEYQLPNQ